MVGGDHLVSASVPDQQGMSSTQFGGVRWKSHGATRRGGIGRRSRAGAQGATARLRGQVAGRPAVVAATPSRGEVCSEGPARSRAPCLQEVLEEFSHATSVAVQTPEGATSSAPTPTKAEVCRKFGELARRSQDGFAAGAGSSLLQMLAGSRCEFDVQLEALIAVDAYCRRNTTNVLLLLQLNGVTAVLNTMASFVSSPEIQEAGCKILCNAAACNQECQVQVASELGGARAIVKAMSAHPEAAHLQELGCKALRDMAAYNSTNQETIVLCGGIPRVLAAMEANAQLASIQALGCGVLRNISACNTDHQEAIVSRCGVEIIMSGMAAHPESADVQCAGCWALFCLSVQNAEVQRVVDGHGAAQSVLAAMEMCPMEPRVQEAGCWFIKEFGKVIAASRSTTYFVRCCQAAMKALERHTSVASVHTAATGALRSLATHDKSGWAQTLCLGRAGRIGRTAAKQTLAAIAEDESSS